jgi:signal peptidase II
VDLIKNRLALLAYALAAVVIALDQALKYWVLNVFGLPNRPPTEVVGPFWLSMVWNKGVSFGVFNFDSGAARWPLTIFAVGIAGALAWWARKLEKPILAVAIGLIIGGALGNAIDRVRIGAVADFLDFSRLWFPWIFNVADSAITVGAVLLIWDLFVPEARAWLTALARPRR